MPHFMQLLYQQFHPVLPALSMQLFVIDFFSEKTTNYLVFLKQNVSKHQHISTAFLHLHYMNMMACGRPIIDSILYYGGNQISARWLLDEQMSPINCCWCHNPIHYAGVLSLMSHFIQLFYQQFHSNSPDLSMHLFVINLCCCFFLIAYQHYSVFVMQTVSRHQHKSPAVLYLNCVNMMSTRLSGGHQLNAMFGWQADIGRSSAQWVKAVVVDIGSAFGVWLLHSTRKGGQAWLVLIHPLNLLRADSKRHTPGPFHRRHAKPRDVNIASMGKWPPWCRLPAKVDEVPSGTQWLRVQYQCEPPGRRTSAVVWHGEEWALPCDISQDTPHEDDNHTSIYTGSVVTRNKDLTFHCWPSGRGWNVCDWLTNIATCYRHLEKLKN